MACVRSFVIIMSATMVLATQTASPGKRFRSVPELWPSLMSTMHSVPNAHINSPSAMKRLLASCGRRPRPVPGIPRWPECLSTCSGIYFLTIADGSIDLKFNRGAVDFLAPENSDDQGHRRGLGHLCMVDAPQGAR